MQELCNGLILYHRSYCEVREPDLQKCNARKDFGKGFYLTSSKEQAESFLKTSIVKAITKGDADADQNYGFISVFKLDMNSELYSYLFETADINWLHCIAAHRKRKLFDVIEKEMAAYDVIAGKIADDQTNTTLTAYIGGAFGQIGSKEADEFCIKRLLPDKLKDQYCFKTEKAIGCLTFVESEKVWIRK